MEELVISDIQFTSLPIELQIYVISMLSVSTIGVMKKVCKQLKNATDTGLLDKINHKKIIDLSINIPEARRREFFKFSSMGIPEYLPTPGIWELVKQARDFIKSRRYERFFLVYGTVTEISLPPDLNKQLFTVIHWPHHLNSTDLAKLEELKRSSEFVGNKFVTIVVQTGPHAMSYIDIRTGGKFVLSEGPLSIILEDQKCDHLITVVNLLSDYKTLNSKNVGQVFKIDFYIIEIPVSDLKSGSIILPTLQPEVNE